MKQGHLFRCPCFIIFSFACLENSTVRGNNSQDSSPENELIPCLIKVALIQVRRLSVRASRQFSNHLKPDSFSLSSDSHIHFPLIPLTVIMWFLDLVYIIALHVSQKLPSIEYDDEYFLVEFSYRESDSSETNSGLAYHFSRQTVI